MTNEEVSRREIPYNYTSADDRQAVLWLLGPETWQKLEALRQKRVTGRSARVLMQFLGDILICRRNPYLLHELLEAAARRRRFFKRAEESLALIAESAGGEPLVLEVLQDSRRLLAQFQQELHESRKARRALKRQAGALIGRENVLFDPFTLVSHATDATDWRLHLPWAVLTPTAAAQVGPLLQLVAKLGLNAIPRGGGTGLSGGAVPLRSRCVIINTEKLNHISGIVRREIPQADGTALPAAIIQLEAGVLTEAAMDYAAQEDLVFATDPTSAWAATIGGNIAENAGGKSAVLWGTAIDNLISFSMVMPSGETRRIQRHQHPGRKIQPHDQLLFAVCDQEGQVLEQIQLAGSAIRKPGLWKDITNKALGGLPGLQKEGTDGVIVSAEFILHPAYPHRRTLCLEFFGADFDEASLVIRNIVAALPNRDAEALQALEHFDDRYVRAIGYQVKAPRSETPKAVLLIDVVGHSAAEVQRGVAVIKEILAAYPNTFMLEARDAAQARLFWKDRKRLGAIAARTNAFKLNEDIVLPLAALAPFARFIDHLNAEEERFSQKVFARRAAAYLGQLSSGADQPFLAEKIPGAQALCADTETHLDHTAAPELFTLRPAQELLADLLERFRGYEELGHGLQNIFAEVRLRLLVLATHMHAGDGNVHVNIPILSNDQPMMQRAYHLVDLVMARVKELGGAVSGEHGIGVTKLKYLEAERLAALADYRRKVDPGALMNPGKLSDLEILEQIYTPSFNLLELEARILQHGSLEDLALRVAQCVRCGRCKPNCCVFYPGQSLFYHPRNKNLAIGALIEALLYDAQRERSTGFELLRYLEDVADHCTICHKCLEPCPVNIDSGEVSVLERELLSARKFKHSPAAVRVMLHLLGSSSALLNRKVYAPLLRQAVGLQRMAAKVAAPLLKRRPQLKLYPLPLLRSPAAKLDPGTLRDYLPQCGPDQALLLNPRGEVKHTVFYFPGCGSERFFSQISAAAIYVLLELDSRVLLPPPFLCCGFPAYANARPEHQRTILRDTIIFSQIREMFRHFSFASCIVTCGTCRESLSGMDLGQIFGAPVEDLAAFAAAQGLRLPPPAQSRSYHAPCHDSLDAAGPRIYEKITGVKLETVPHCCSEAGTLALSRPDIAHRMLDRKCAALAQAAPRGGVILTNCPSCLQGLGRSAPLGFSARHLALELAEALGGGTWFSKLEQQLDRAELTRF